tara:strand:+ start:5046 stop:5207 length:162 start_codon:yes stop_codon:yes gene_type:complete
MCFIYIEQKFSVYFEKLGKTGVYRPFFGNDNFVIDPQERFGAAFRTNQNCFSL